MKPIYSNPLLQAGNKFYSALKLTRSSLLSSFTILVILLFQACTSPSVLTSFSTGGHTVFHLEPATVGKNGERAIISAAYDGSVLCHTHKGKLLWKTRPGDGFPFDLAVADIDNDGLDEAMIASSDGNLYVLDHNGQSMWTFTGEAPLYQVGVAKSPDGSILILTGGVERVLYALSPEGVLISSYEADGVIRLIGSGNILGDGQDYAAVSTARSGLSGNFTLRLHRLPGLEPLWEKPMRDVKNRHRYYSLEVFDLDGDGKDEMVYGMMHNNSGELTIFDDQGNSRVMTTCDKIRARPYKMNFVSHIKSTSLQDEFFLNLSGSDLLVFNMDGTCRSILEGPFSFAGTAFDPVTNTYWLGSSISGGDGIYGLQMDMPGWEDAFLNIKPVGKIAQLDINMANLLSQVENFQPPSYQKPVSGSLVTLGESPDEIKERYLEPYSFKNVVFASYKQFIEYYDPGITDPEFRAEWESRHSSQITPREEIIQYAKDREQAGEHFFIFAGHGRSFGIDFYISPITMVEMLKVAPNTLHGFVFAEFEATDEHLKRAINEQLLPLADSCFIYGKKKIFVRNKNIFWNGNVHLDMFKPLMANERYREVFVPSMEETNSRSQSLSLAGRTGLWMTGSFNHMSGRAVTDNANYNRIWEWGQTKRLSHFVRALSLSRVLGADHFQVNIYTDNQTEMLPFYLMLEKGILPMPEPEDILSISSLTIGISTPDKDYIRHGSNGHNMAQYSPDEGEFVFDRLACYWGGSLIPDHDFEHYAMGAKRRMTNFIPQSPYGNLTTISAETDLNNFPSFSKMLVTDGKYWYDPQGKPHTAKEYKSVVIDALEEAASSLPLRVYGEAGWVAIRIDSTHIRLVVMDPGYLDPDDREAEVVFQHIDAVEVRDILSGEIISVKDGKFNLNIPLGILRVLDITHTDPVAI